jgi:hypothetical protein
MKDRSKYLLRIAMADQAFKEADAMADHILSSKLDPGGHLYFACVAGVVTCYCRPFMSAQGLGPLPKDFEDFTASESPSDYARMHSDMLVARDKLQAHFDFHYGEAEFHGQRYMLHPGEVELYLGTDGYEIRTNHTILPPQRIEFARKLIEFQQARIQKQLTDFAISMLEETGGKLGSYVFVPKKRST